MLDHPQRFLRSLPNKPGVYQMYNACRQILYVGKAKNLKRRLSSYFHTTNDPKTELFMAQVNDIEVIVTPDENTALLLENNLIKTKKPRYNILFKDDKSFPYLLLSQHDFPRLSIHRGVVNKALGRYFGPFPAAAAVNFVLDLIQKIFRLRACKDSFMRHRSRPCMLYQIKRCCAPCVGYIDKNAYAVLVELVKQFLNGSSNYVMQQLTKLMDASVAKLDYEQAAIYRDQIINIRKLQFEQVVTRSGGNCEVIALMAKDDVVCISVLFIRNGLVIGNKNYFPTIHNLNLSLDDILDAFVIQHYLQDNIIVPKKILLNLKLRHRSSLERIFREKFGRKIILSNQVKGVQKRLVAMAEANAANALATYCKSRENYSECLQDFQRVFRLASMPQRIECFDVSHSMGESQVASCVVFDMNGPSKKDYRRFNIKAAQAGDDCGALREALLRRYSDTEKLSDVIMVDGGVGQLNVATKVLKKLQSENVILIAVAKGKERKPGLEEIYIQGKTNPLILPANSHALHFIQQVRDEAHRFAINAHRKKMLKSRNHSELENIVGIGKSRRTALLKYFGGLTLLKSAGINDLVKVKGISRNLAERIYKHLHG